MHHKKIYLSLGIILVVFLWGFLSKDNFSDIKNIHSGGTSIVAFGDSLVFGVGSSREGGFVSILSEEIGQPIINLGVSGNTTRDGLKRADEILENNPKIVIILLGGNDYLRQLPRKETFENVSKIIEKVQSGGSAVLLLGVRGGILSDHFDEEFDGLAKKYKTGYVPDVLDGLFGKREYMYDSVHPNDVGYKIIADKIKPVIRGMLEAGSK